MFKARHRLMDRVVALKVVLPDCVRETSAAGRFFREMKIVGRLDHVNVVRALDADEYKGCPYIIMEHLEGEDLEQVLQRRGILPWNEVVDYMAQASWGLAHAHERGVIHRDIKPTNLFLVDTGIVKVLDLGFSVLVGPSEYDRSIFDTDEGKVVGTLDYVSPEQVREEAIDARTDLFSLGCTMYRLLTGSYAFPGVTQEHRLIKRLHEKPVPITDSRVDLPYRLSAIVDRLLALCPDDRFGSAVEVAEALEALTPSAVRPIASHARGVEAESLRPASHLLPQSPKPRPWTGPGSNRHSVRRATASEKRRPPEAGTNRNLTPGRVSPRIVSASKRQASNPGRRSIRSIATN